MDANTINRNQATRVNPLVAGAAVAVMILSLIGVGVITGVLPHALSQKQGDSPATGQGLLGRYAQTNNCANCGTVESIRTVELPGDASGLGAVAGGVTGAVIGNQMGRGRGNTAMTIIGAAGGAFAGNEIEKNMQKRYAYRVTVRMDDGSFRTVSQTAPPAFAVGEKVRVVDGTLVSARS